MKAGYVIRREYTEAIRRKAFMITTFVVPIVMSMFLVLPVMFAKMEPQTVVRVAVLDQTGNIAPQFVAALTDTLKNGKRQFSATIVPAAASYDAERGAQIDAIKREETDVVVAIPQGIMTGEKASYITREQRNYNVLERFEKVLNDVVLKQRLAHEGLDFERVKNLTEPVSLEMNQITSTGSVEKKSFMAEYGVVFVFVMLLYTSIQSWGVTIAKSIVEEKSSRIIEVLLSTVTPRDLIIGKLVGVGLAGFTQLGMWTVMGLVLSGGGLPVMLAAKMGSLHIPPITFLYFVMFFVLGFLLFASLFMVIGAVSSTEQDAQQMQILVTMPMLVPLMSLMLFMQNPNSALAVGMSLFPPFTPLLMMARIILLMPPMWQILLAIGLMLATILVAVTFAARIFRVGILMHGKRPNLREMIHWYRMAG